MSQSSDFIDVNQLIAESSIEELNRQAEAYFAQTTDWTFHLSKPFGAIDETPQLLINFSVVLQGLSLCRGMTVLEFGAGTCWASRFLTQLGCAVVAMDISPTALRIGQELYSRNPVFGPMPEPRFLEFDGYHIDLPDKSVDRIVCFHALHHVPNPQTVLAEFGRVLKNGGIAGFAEPGPEHSRKPQSQEEMRNFGVVENDVDTEEIWRDAKKSGFTDIKLAIFNVPPLLVSRKDFADFLRGGGTSRAYAKDTAEYLRDQRTFFLYKGETPPLDSRYPAGLKASISVEPAKIFAREGEPIELRAKVVNAGSVVWLPRVAGVGAVQLGCHVYLADGNVYRKSYHWEALTEGDGVPIKPNQMVETKVTLPPLPPGSYLLEFDLVSNDIAWFAQSGSPTVKVPLQVITNSTQ